MQYFIITNTVADIYGSPGFTGSVVTQGILGETCSVLDKNENWILVQMEDGYKGWIHEFYGILNDEPYVTNIYSTDLFSMIFDKNNNIIKRIVFGSRMYVSGNETETTVVLPDGTEGILRSKIVDQQWKTKREELTFWASQFIGIPYRWGGRTSYGFDCSGLVQTVFYAAEKRLPRDAWQQSEFLGSNTLDPRDLEPGDLLFFAKEGKITHVGISTGGETFIHSQGEVRVNSLDSGNKFYSKKLSDMNVTGKSINSVLK